MSWIWKTRYCSWRQNLFETLFTQRLGKQPWPPGTLCQCDALALSWHPWHPLPSWPSWTHDERMPLPTSSPYPASKNWTLQHPWPWESWPEGGQGVESKLDENAHSEEKCILEVKHLKAHKWWRTFGKVFGNPSQAIRSWQGSWFHRAQRNM